MRAHWLGIVLCFLVVLGSSAPSAVAQAALSFAQLNGTVLDAGGRAVVGAKVVVRDLDTNQGFQATTNTAGFFVVPNLPPGKYELTVSALGFANISRPALP